MLAGATDPVWKPRRNCMLGKRSASFIVHGFPTSCGKILGAQAIPKFVYPTYSTGFGVRPHSASMIIVRSGLQPCHAGTAVGEKGPCATFSPQVIGATSSVYPRVIPFERKKKECKVHTPRDCAPFECTYKQTGIVIRKSYLIIET